MLRNVRQNLGPAISSALSTSLERAVREHPGDIERLLGRLAHVTAREAVLGANDGFQTIRRENRDAILRPLRQSLVWLRWLVGLVAATLLICLAGMVWLAQRRRA